LPLFHHRAAKGADMEKNKTINSIPDNLKYSSPFNFEKYTLWKSLELIILGYKIGLLNEAVPKRDDSSKDQKEVLKNLKANVAFIGDVFKLLTQGKELNEETISEDKNLLARADFLAHEDTIRQITRRFWNLSAHVDTDLEGYVISNLRDSINHARQILKTIKITEPQSLKELSHACLMLGIQSHIPRDIQKNIQIPNKDLEEFIKIEQNLRNISCEALGYWTAQLPRNKRNWLNAKTRTTKKEENKATVKKWLETMTPDQCRIKAQTELGIKDRTYLNYIHEINEEKNQRNRNARTALLRKNDDSAKS